MPSEHCILQDVPYVEQVQPQAQVKLCSSCHCQLSPESISLLHPEVAIVCTTCRERICAHRNLIDHSEHQKDDELHVEDFGLLVVDHDVPMSFRVPTPPPAAPSLPHSLVSPSSPIPIPHHRQLFSPPASPSTSPDTHNTPSSPSTYLADPHADITRLRVRSHSLDCLFPGAQFSGTQKSGRSSYEVSVTIVVSSCKCDILQVTEYFFRTSILLLPSFAVISVSAVSPRIGLNLPLTSMPRSSARVMASSPMIGVPMNKRT